jgi:hypothetical protein
MSAAKAANTQSQTAKDAVQADYHPEVKLEPATGGKKKAVLSLPDPLSLHKTVHYWTPVSGDKVIVEFKKARANSPTGFGSPYLTATGKPKMKIVSTSRSKPLELRNEGTFFAECYIERLVMKLGKKVPQKIGYDEGGGGNHVVR